MAAVLQLCWRLLERGVASSAAHTTLLTLCEDDNAAELLATWTPPARLTGLPKREACLAYVGPRLAHVQPSIGRALLSVALTLGLQGRTTAAVPS